MSREEKVRASQNPNCALTFGRDPDDPTWDVSSHTYPDWSAIDGGAEGVLALLASHLHGCKWEDRLPGLRPSAGGEFTERYIDRDTFVLRLIDALYPHP